MVDLQIISFFGNQLENGVEVVACGAENVVDAVAFGAVAAAKLGFEVADSICGRADVEEALPYIKLPIEHWYPLAANGYQ